MSDTIHDIALWLERRLSRLAYSFRTIWPKKVYASNGQIVVGDKVKVHTHDPSLINDPVFCTPYCDGKWHGRVEIVKYDQWGRLNFNAPKAELLEKL